MNQSLLKAKAEKILSSVRGQRIALSKRKELAVELAATLIALSTELKTTQETRQQKLIAEMMEEPGGKVFLTRVTDQCFRTEDNKRTASQLSFLIKRYGVPRFAGRFKRVGLLLFKLLSPRLTQFLVPAVKKLIHSETARVIIPGEGTVLQRHILKRKKEGIRVNINHLGEAVLGEEEVKKRLETYITDLKKPEIESISVKVTTIGRSINHLAWDETLAVLEKRLALLYKTAMEVPYQGSRKEVYSKLVNLDMEEYHDLHLTLQLFFRTLERPEFKSYTGGIVLQSYLPDSYTCLKMVTEWAKKRVQEGGAPVRLRLVKGANLAMEKVDSSIRSLPLPTYATKAEVDANFKRMVDFAFRQENAEAVHIGIASHNIFDVAYALLLREERGVTAFTSFEMLEGMAMSMCRALHLLCPDMLLYCPTAKKREFVNAVAYLVRRLDENSAPDNFLRHAFNLIPGQAAWERQRQAFESALNKSREPQQVTCLRTQDRSVSFEHLPFDGPFDNEPNSDWSHEGNRLWIKNALNAMKKKRGETIPLVIGGKELVGAKVGKGFDPSEPLAASFYHYAIAGKEEVELALSAAKEGAKPWALFSARERSLILAKVAKQLRERRGELIAAMVADAGKIVSEADSEVSEAVDFIEYYRRTAEEIEGLDDLSWKPKGVVLVTPPWNFPLAIPVGGLAAALATGNGVIFKPASETVLVGLLVARAFWDAGVDRAALQFLVCDDEEIGSALIEDERVDSVILTGASATAKAFLDWRPNLDLHAETGGKNSIIVTNLADRDLAIKEIVTSAFLHAGQKCSACSLAIVEAALYDDPHFFEQLRDAAASMPVGSAWDPSTEVSPLIKPPQGVLKRALEELEPGERWLLKGGQKDDNENLWSPSIKVGVTPGSFTHQTEFFGPLLAVIRADNLSHAIEIANATPYGLTAGLHSLDPREQQLWIESIEAGNLYINRTITGAIVERQPFGGCKESSFGRGIKAGGPNYLMQLMQAEKKGLPKGREAVNKQVMRFCKRLSKKMIGDMDLFNASICSYAYFWQRYFSRDHDPALLVGQDNLLRYLPRPLILRLEEDDLAVDYFRVIAAALTVGAKLQVSASNAALLKYLKNLPGITTVKEDVEALGARLCNCLERQIRVVGKPSAKLLRFSANHGLFLLQEPVSANGRVELLHHLREVSISYSYHRYGNLGSREREKRKSP